MEPYQATLFRELDNAGVSYVLCGGLAVILHRIHRFTADIDLAVALDRDNLQRFIGVVTRLGYRPRAPVSAQDLLDPAKRRRWQDEKRATVFTFVDPAVPYRQIDAFLEDALPFAALQAQSILQHGEGYAVPIASVGASACHEAKDPASAPARCSRYRDARAGEGACACGSLHRPETDAATPGIWTKELYGWAASRSRTAN
jgi:hypothetical protein